MLTVWARLARSYPANMRRGNAIAPSELRLCEANSIANLCYLLVRQLCRRVILPSGLLVLTAHRRVSHIIGMASPAQMKGIYAPFIVTGMKSVSALWSWMTREFQRDLMREPVSFADAKNTIASCIAMSIPRQASLLIRRTNFLLEATFQFQIKRVYRAISHDAVLSRGGQGRAVVPTPFRPADFSRFLYERKAA